MASYFACVLLVLAIFPFLLVTADEQLIQMECHNAEVPTTCIECLKSDRRSETTDRVGIAVIIVSWLSNNAENLANNMSMISYGNKVENATNILRKCSKWLYSAATKDLGSATLSLKSGRYAGAERSVNRAVVYAAYCRHVIEGIYKAK